MGEGMSRSGVRWADPWTDPLGLRLCTGSSPLRPSGTSPNKGGGLTLPNRVSIAAPFNHTIYRVSTVYPPPLLGEVSPQATEGG